MAHTQNNNTASTLHSVTKRRFWKKADTPIYGMWPMGWLWLLGALLAFVYGLMITAPDIQAKTQNKVSDSLVDSGYDDLTVSADGQEVFVTGSGQPLDVERISAIAKGAACDTWIAGNVVCPTKVRVDLIQPLDEASAPPPTIEPEPEIAIQIEPAITPRPHRFTLTLKDDEVVLIGEVPDQETHDQLLSQGQRLRKRIVNNLRITNEPATSALNWAITQTPDILSKMNTGGVRWASDTLSSWGQTSAENKLKIEQMYSSNNTDSRFGNLNLQVPEEVNRCNQEFASVLSASTIRFNTGSAVIAKSSQPLLQKLASLAQSCDMNLAIEGHTDNVGSEELNQALSMKRAESVVTALSNLSVEPGRLKAHGFGPSQPVADNNSRTGRAKNRRIEIKAAKFD